MMEYWINENGANRKMTPKETAEYEKILENMPPPVPSLEDEVAQLKADNAELREALNALLERRVQ